MSKILVIDDDFITRLFIKKALQAQGHEVTVATNGREGIQQAKQLQPALIICDWIMPEANGLEVCRQVRGDLNLSTTFFILLTSRTELADRIEALNAGADDFLIKPIDVNELQARVRSGLRLYRLNQDLQTQKQILEAELQEAATYVRSLLPPPMFGRVNIEARFIPSRELGGDCFDYFWLDPDRLVMYLLDVSGHGLGAALPSSLILNLIRLQSLPDVNFYEPQDVLRGLNEAFQMNKQNEKFFTIWYGIYHYAERQLTYASAGHPPAILITQTLDRSLKAEQLRTPNLPIGLWDETHFVCARHFIPAQSILYIFSDGIYDFIHPYPHQWNLNTFVDLLTKSQPESTLDDVLNNVHRSVGLETFEDDLSLLKVSFK